MTHRIFLYPIWLRLWHWTNAVFFMVLIVTGLSLHYATPANTILPFSAARILHNFTGIALSIAYLVFLLGNVFTPNGKHYIPTRHELTDGLWRQLKFYLIGIFRGDPHPYGQSPESKFNPLQKVTYLGIMYFAAPVVIVTGLLLLFPELAPQRIWNVAGILPMAVAHSAAGFLLSLFLVGHVYLASTGATVAANYEAMITGYHTVEHPHDAAAVRMKPDSEPVPEEDGSNAKEEKEATSDETAKNTSKQPAD